MNLIRAIFLILFFCSPGFADTLWLSSGLKIEGKIVSVTEDRVVMDRNNGDRVSFSIRQLEPTSAQYVKNLPKTVVEPPAPAPAPAVEEPAAAVPQAVPAAPSGNQENPEDTYSAPKTFSLSPDGTEEPAPEVSQQQQGHLGKVEEVPATGVYAEIDVKLMKEAIDILTGPDPERKAATIEEISSHPEQYPPVVFYFLSEVLFDRDRKDEATFWFYAGQLRGRFDANRCADVSARSGIDELTERFGPRINQYAFQDVEKLTKVINDVIEWDKKTPHSYDHRWINLHGMQAMIGSLESQAGKTAAPPPDLSLPESEWDDIQKKTQDDYLSGFQEVVNMMKTAGQQPVLMDGEMMKAKALMEKKECDQALAVLDGIVEKDPANVTAYMGRAWCYEEKQEFKSAVKEYFKVLEIRPDATEVYKPLGLAYLADGNNWKADENIKKYVEAFPDDGEAWYALAYANKNEDYLQKAEALGHKDTLGVRQAIEQERAGRQKRDRTKGLEKMEERGDALVNLLYLIPIFLAGIVAFFRNFSKKNLGSRQNPSSMQTQTHEPVTMTGPRHTPDTAPVPSSQRFLGLMFVAGSIINLVVLFFARERINAEGIGPVLAEGWMIFAIVYGACFIVGMVMYGLMVATKAAAQKQPPSGNPPV